MTKLSPTFGSLTHLPSPSRTLLNKQAMKDYVYFSDNTKGQTGKAVKIKIDLFPRFAALVDPKTHKGQTIIRQIENLRMVNGASAGVYSNANCAFRYMLQVPGLKVFYTVLDGMGQSGKEIFIGDLKLDYKEGSDKAGLYVYNSFFNQYKKCKQADLNGKSVYLNGQCKDLQIALENAKSRVALTKDKLALFYTPGHCINDLGVWESRETAQKTHDAACKLYDVIKFNYDKKVEWIAEEGGAEILSKALDSFSGNLSGHKFRLIDPLTNTPALLQKLTSKNVKPTIDEIAPVAYTGANRATNIYMESQKQSIISALKALRVKGYAEDPHQSTIADLAANSSVLPVRQNQQAMSNAAVLNNKVSHSKSFRVAPDKAALTFITALKRV